MEQRLSLPSARSLLKEAWAIFKSKLGVLVGISAITSVLALILSVMFPTQTDTSMPVNVNPLFFVLVLIIVIAEMAVQIALVQAADESIGIADSYKKALPKIWPFFWTSILMGLIVLGGFMLLIVPGIIFAFWYSMFSYVLILENLKGMAALRKSREYVKGYIGQIFWRGLVIIVVTFVACIPGAIFGESVIGTIINFVVFLFFVPYSVVYSYLVFKHLREIKTASQTPQDLNPQPTEAPSVV